MEWLWRLTNMTSIKLDLDVEIISKFQKKRETKMWPSLDDHEDHKGHQHGYLCIFITTSMDPWKPPKEYFGMTEKAIKGCCCLLWWSLSNMSIEVDVNMFMCPWWWSWTHDFVSTKCFGLRERYYQCLVLDITENPVLPNRLSALPPITTATTFINFLFVSW